jgi:hypothetical protein
LCFLYGQNCWAFIHMFIGHLYFFFRVLPIHLFIYSVGCWFFERLVFWAVCVFWLLIPF